MTRLANKLAPPGLLLMLCACETPASTSDATAPEVTITVSRAHGENIFRTNEIESSGNCAYIPELPVQVTLIVGDSGGVASAALRNPLGSIVSGSIHVSPGPPESSFTLDANTVTITLSPPTATTVRTGVIATMDVDGRLPIGVVGFARDRAGHYSELLVELRPVQELGVQSCPTG